MNQAIFMSIDSLRYTLELEIMKSILIKRVFQDKIKCMFQVKIILPKVILTAKVGQNDIR